AVVPYQDFTCADGEVLVAIGNDRQFRQFMALLGRDDLATDPRFASSPLRSGNRAALLAEMGETIAQWRAEDLIAAMQAAGLPGGKVNSIP
ncbi:CoA transferase, partial [Vibrio parahaemolyticus]